MLETGSAGTPPTHPPHAHRTPDHVRAFLWAHLPHAPHEPPLLSRTVVRAECGYLVAFINKQLAFHARVMHARTTDVCGRRRRERSARAGLCGT